MFLNPKRDFLKVLFLRLFNSGKWIFIGAAYTLNTHINQEQPSTRPSCTMVMKIPLGYHRGRILKIRYLASKHTYKNLFDATKALWIFNWISNAQNI